MEGPSPRSSSSPVDSSQVDADFMRAELTSYLASLTTSTSVTLAPEFGHLVDSLSAHTTSSNTPVDTPHRLSNESLINDTDVDPLTQDRQSGTDAVDLPTRLSSISPSTQAAPSTLLSPHHAAAEESQGLGEVSLMVPLNAMPLLAGVPAITAALHFDEAAEMRKIADLDALIERLTFSSIAMSTPRPLPHSSLPLQPSFVDPPPPSDFSSPAPHSDEEDGQTTFLTAVSTRESLHVPYSPYEEQKELTLTPHSPYSTPDDVDEVEGVPLQVTAGEGFTLTPQQSTQLSAIDVLISSLHAEEKAGKKRRFTSRRRSPILPPPASEVATRKVRKEGKSVGRPRRGRQGGQSANTKLPSISSQTSVAIPFPLAPGDGVGMYVEALSHLLDDCLSTAERQRLEDINARLPSTFDPSADPVVPCDSPEPSQAEGRHVRFEAFDAERYRRALHPHPSTTYSSIRQCYGKEQPIKPGGVRGHDTEGQAETDQYEWMDEGLEEDTQSTRLIDDSTAADSILPDSDDDTQSVLLSQLRALDPAPDSDGPTPVHGAHSRTEEEGGSERAGEGGTAEKAQAVRVGNEGVRKRVQRLIREADERRRTLGEGEADGRRVRTSDERRQRVGPHLTPLDRRPASAEAAGAGAVDGGRRS